MTPSKTRSRKVGARCSNGKVIAKERKSSMEFDPMIRPPNGRSRIPTGPPRPRAVPDTRNRHPGARTRLRP